MKYWLIIPVVILVLLQTAVIDFNLLLVFLLSLALLAKEKEALAFGFLGGVLLDLSAGTRLGVSSLGYLLPVMAVILFARKFQTLNVIFWIVLFFGSSLFFCVLQGETWYFKDGLLTVVLGLPVYFLASRMEIFDEDEGIRLRI